MTTMPERTATLTELVAAQIRSLLGYRDIRPSELARKLGENDQWLSVRLKGRVPINVNDMHRIAKVLDVPVGQLMPPPEIAAGAAEPRTTHGYQTLPLLAALRTGRPRDNRPTGHPVTTATIGVVRTAHVSRPARRKRDR